MLLHRQENCDKFENIETWKIQFTACMGKSPFASKTSIYLRTQKLIKNTLLQNRGLHIDFMQS